MSLSKTQFFLFFESGNYVKATRKTVPGMNNSFLMLNYQIFKESSAFPPHLHSSIKICSVGNRTDYYAWASLILEASGEKSLDFLIKYNKKEYVSPPI